VFSHELAEPSWNLLAREVSMIMLNPRHPSVTAAGLSLKPAPAHPTTVIRELSHFRQLGQAGRSEWVAAASDVLARQRSASPHPRPA
jgi:hypothetical protein